MHIKNIFFPLPIIVDYLNDNNEEERKILFFDQHKGSFLPIDSSISEENLNFICKEIFNKFEKARKNMATYELEKIMPVTDLKKIPEYVQKVNEMKEGHIDKFRKNETKS